MAPLKDAKLPHPLNGIVRRFSHDDGQLVFTPAAQNVWACDQSVGQNGRSRISTRPGITSTGLSIGIPYNSCECTFLNSSVTYRGVMVTHHDGTRIFYVDSSGVIQQFAGGDIITTDPGSDFSSCAVFMGKPYQTALGGELIAGNFASAGAGTAQTSAPDDCGLVVAHGGRLWLAGDSGAPHVIYASRVGGDTTTPGDLNTSDAWDTTLTDDGAAWASTGSQGGIIGEPITALASHTEDCLIVFSLASSYVIRGNPNTGQIVRLSPIVGSVMQSAWCHDGTGSLWYISGDGMYRIPPGCGTGTESVSRESLPEDFVAINPGVTGTYVSLSYDPRFRCLWLFVDTASTDQFWSYDLQQKGGGWWQHTFSGGPLRLGALLKPAVAADKSELLAINATGTIYQFDRESSESFTSYCLYGPLALGGTGREGILHAVQASIATGSSSVSWKVYTGQTAEAAYDKAVADTAAFTGSAWAAGLNRWQNPGSRGAFAFIKVHGTTTDRWSIEAIDAKLKQLGLRRVTT